MHQRTQISMYVCRVGGNDVLKNKDAPFDYLKLHLHSVNISVRYLHTLLAVNFYFVSLEIFKIVIFGALRNTLTR